MTIRPVLAALLALFLSLQAFATPFTNSTVCKNPTTRKEWRSLTVDERKNYIRAVKCLLDSKPKTQSLAKNIRNRYEDFVAMHLNTTLGGFDLNTFKGPETLMFQFMADPTKLANVMVNHGPDQILPWHRWTIKLYEDALRDECGYKGGQPYWDYHLDSQEAGGDFMKSPIFDPVSGFGGNGGRKKFEMPFNTSFLDPFFPGLQVSVSVAYGGGCIEDGPFRDVMLHVGPSGQMAGAAPRCITRHLNPMHINRGATKKNYARVLRSKTFREFGLWIEAPDFDFTSGVGGHSHGGGNTLQPNSDFHTIGHGAIGGEMMDPMNSVNDPIFWMHHTSMDRLWALWQDQDHANRVNNPPNLTMWVGSLDPINRTVADVYDTLNRNGKGMLCYKYEGRDFQYYNS